MYIVFGNEIIDSMEVKEVIEANSEFKIVKDMSKGSKRDDVVAFNLSVSISILDELMKENKNIKELNEDELFEEYITLAEKLADNIKEHIPAMAIMDIRAYKWDKSDNDVKLVMAMVHQDTGKSKLRDVMKRLITQGE